MILYRCLLDSRSAAERLSTEVKSLADDGVLPDASATEPASGNTLVLLRGDNRAVIDMRWLSPVERNALVAVGMPGLTYSLEFTPDEETPDAVGLCWDALTAINALEAVDVWINDRFYREERIRDFAPVRFIEFDDETAGHVMTGAEYAKLLDSRG
jgi:hypothetical protein